MYTKDIALLTIGIGLNIDDLTLCPICFALIRISDKSLYKDCILCPRFQISHQPPRMILMLRIRRPVRRLNIHYCPAIGTTDVLPIKLCHIPKRTDPIRRKKMVLFKNANKYLYISTVGFNEELWI